MALHRLYRLAATAASNRSVIPGATAATVAKAPAEKAATATA